MQKVMTQEMWDEAKSTYLNGNITMAELAKRYSISVWSIRQRSKTDRWPTPARILSAASRSDLPDDDPSKLIANNWDKRKADARERLFQGTSKAMKKFLRNPSTPRDWKEAQVAQNLLDKAIDPDSEQGNSASVQIAVLQGNNPWNSQ